MFKSKADFNSFDKNNSKVKNLDPSKVKALSKGGVKKLLGNEGEKTPFHLIIDYFLDEKGKALGHFFDLGINKKLSKHFEQVEMKSGKLDKSMSDSPKKASSGDAYIKKINGKKIVHIEPKNTCKVPPSQWNKVLKSLKSSFGGLQAVVVIGGEILEMLPDNAKNETAPKVKPKNEVGLNLKKIMIALSTDMKTAIKKVAANVKKKKISDTDKDVTESILTKFFTLKDLFEEANDDTKEKFKANYEALMKYLPKVEKIKSTLDNLLSKGNKEELVDLDKEIQDFLVKLQKGSADFDVNFAKNKKEIDTIEVVPIKGGQDFINELF